LTMTAEQLRDKREFISLQNNDKSALYLQHELLYTEFCHIIKSRSRTALSTRSRRLA